MKTDIENTFPSKATSGPDNDILTTFRTLPKRFIVWDKETLGYIFLNPELLGGKDV